jgi:Uma2 family endonuclease
MTATPWQGRLLTLDEFAALPEDNSRRYELEEGILVVSPRPTKAHQRVIKRLALILDEQLPLQWEAFTELEVVIVGQNPGTVRVPDVVVAPPDGESAQDAADIVIAVEVTSPGSRRKDTLIKPMEYAKAGIPHYWVIGLDPPVSLTAYTLADGHYQESQTVTAEFAAGDPFPLRIDIPALIVPRGAATEG